MVLTTRPLKHYSHQRIRFCKPFETEETAKLGDAHPNETQQAQKIWRNTAKETAMTTPVLMLELLGFSAGMTTLASSVPQLLANLRAPECAANQNATRNLFQCAGNALWFVYALNVGSIAMATFSTLGCFFAALLLWQVVAAKRRCPDQNGLFA